MLVLSRKQNQKIIIDDNITITVCRIEGDRVQIGIDAPRDILIRREELLSQWFDRKPTGTSGRHRTTSTKTKPPVPHRF